jgi:hypothetical protein
MKHPLYLTMGTLTCLCLLLANLRGWTFFPPSSPNPNSGPGRTVTGFHK